MEDNYYSLKQLIECVDQRVIAIIQGNDRRINDLLTAYTQHSHEQFLLVRGELLTAINVQQLAVSKSEAAYEKRFDTNNEWKQNFASATEAWKATLTEVINKQLPRTEYLPAHEALKDRIGILTTRIDGMEGRNTGIATTLSGIAAAVAIVISLIFGIINYTHGNPADGHVETPAKISTYNPNK